MQDIKTVYEMEPHRFNKQHRGSPWVICSGCGLVRLHNALTEWAVSKGCWYDIHPGWNQARKTLPAQHRNRA